MSNRRLSILAATAGVLAGSGAAIGAPPAATTPHPFVVEVTVTPAVKAKLERLREKIRVSALFSGEPIPAKKKLANEVGEIGLGTEDIELPAAGGTASFNAKIRNDKATWVKEPLLLINVTSAFHGAKDNLLDCGLFQDSLKLAQSKPIRISCKLL